MGLLLNSKIRKNSTALKILTGLQRCLVIMKMMRKTLETARTKTGQNETVSNADIIQVNQDASELL